MTTAEFKKVARLLKEVYKQLETEALSEGIDIFGEEYAVVRDRLRLEVLRRLGFTLEEYRDAKELVAPAKKVDVRAKLEELATKADSITEKVDALEIPDEDELLEKAKELATDIAEKVVKPPTIVNQIVKETTVEKPTIVKQTNTVIEREEFDDSPIWAEIGYFNDRLNSLKIPEGVDEEKMKEELRSEFMEQLQKNINMLGMPDFRKLAMGLQDQIDRLERDIIVIQSPDGTRWQIGITNAGELTATSL